MCVSEAVSEIYAINVLVYILHVYVCVQLLCVLVSDDVKEDKR